MTINNLNYSEIMTNEEMVEMFDPETPETLETTPAPAISSSKSQEVTDMVYETDSLGKALTGRTPERIQHETSIPTEVMFPKDAKILYVGDPWQRMGRELDESHGSNLTIIDYAYGEVASFVRDNEYFRECISRGYTNLNYRIEDLLGEDSPFDLAIEDVAWLKNFDVLIKEANRLSEAAVSDDDYALAAEAWGKAREFIEETHKAEVEKTEQEESEPGDSPSYYDSDKAELDYFRTSAWYDCVYGERGFKDIPDWNNIIKPKIDALEHELTELSENERKKIIANYTRGWIEEIRLQKRTEKSNVVEAVFPQLPFKSGSFDRLVASWSLSAHVFAQLDEEGFEVFWDETHRVLADNGEAYIFPLNYYYYVDETLLNSLEKMKKKHPEMEYSVLDNEGAIVPTDELGTYGEEYTLVLHKGVSDNK